MLDKRTFISGLRDPIGPLGFSSTKTYELNHIFLLVSKESWISVLGTRGALEGLVSLYKSFYLYFIIHTQRGRIC